MTYYHAYRLATGWWIIAIWNQAYSRYESDDVRDMAPDISFMWARTVEKLATFGLRKYRTEAAANRAISSHWSSTLGECAR